ncbi:hypothetical protein EIP91_003076 [Steccherinum ochraceum]|uniref:Uncharacterized protein n=1 Tax=Steccherinum ochraceum TaxID=92696 RepID=A0A4R0RCK5_9APHY|nr:hypothetical protein EIP91_003076 [Steccherinum ochraceum]
MISHLFTDLYRATVSVRIRSSWSLVADRKSSVHGPGFVPGGSSLVIDNVGRWSLVANRSYMVLGYPRSLRLLSLALGYPRFLIAGPWLLSRPRLFVIGPWSTLRSLVLGVWLLVLDIWCLVSGCVILWDMSLLEWAKYKTVAQLKREVWEALRIHDFGTTSF